MNRQILLAERPDGELREDHFKSTETEIPSPGPGEALVRVLLISIDPANRAWMLGRTYRDQLAVGDVMSGFGMAEVVSCPDGSLAEGTIVMVDAGWQEYAVVSTAEATPIAVRGSLSHHLSVLGISGLTAYFGLLDVGRPQPGETVLVSAAAGATGSVVVQLAKLHGCRVVGISSSPEKCAFLEGELGADATVSHRSESLKDDLRRACPDGVDIYFDGVGGPLLGAALSRMNVHGRIACCGVVSQYDRSTPEPSPRGIPGIVVVRRLRMEGFLLDDYKSEWPKGEEQLAAWVESGEIKVVEETLEGLDRAPAALIGLLHGDNIGKRIVRVAAAAA